MNRHRAGSKALIREINEALVLDVVRERGPVSRAEVTSRTGLSAATVTGISGRLLAGGYLVEDEIVRGTGGRPARLLDLSAEGIVVVGVRVSTTEVVAVLVNLRGDVVESRRERLRSCAPEPVARACARAVSALVDQRPGDALLGVGVALSGVVDQERGRVRHSGALGWQDVAFRDLLTSEIGAPVVIDSFANAVAMGLLLFDGSSDARDLLVFSVGASLGAGVVIGGRLHRGWDGSAGGFAHSRILGGTDAGRTCHCGAVGCLETRSSHWGIQGELGRLGLDPSDLGAAGAEVVLADAARCLGTSMANASKLVGPERVVVAYAPEMDVSPMVDGVRRAFEEQYVHENSSRPELERGAVAPADLARGAAYVVLAQLFASDPDRQPLLAAR